MTDIFKDFWDGFRMKEALVSDGEFVCDSCGYKAHPIGDGKQAVCNDKEGNLIFVCGWQKNAEAPIEWTNGYKCPRCRGHCTEVK